ncbi:glycosyltransferase family 1 protein [Roseovarius spongiae]|uniref:Glycosyltransferase family 1 protein n=1 Tax=Roseovarius spongiae TaxID=2320272 RepID=A0A3A8AUP1_9RHOB|nr:glycosyltransferase [Roseovarius spongiae]RKF14747.1 glycosyltransferase family 1 protein [Roseovarius spongiae]
MTPAARPRIRVAMLVTRMDIGGVPDHVMSLIDGFSDDIHVTLICDHIHPAHDAEARARGADVILLSMRRMPGLFSDIRTFLALRRLLRGSDFDILHTHMSKAALLGALIGVSTPGLRVVNTAHNLGFIAMPARWKKLVFWVYDRIIATIGIDATVTVSQTVADIAARARLIPRARLHVIRNGIRLAPFDERLAAAAPEAADLPAGAPLILSVARLVWFKGLDTAIDAMALLRERCPEARLMLVGDGELRGPLAAQAAARGVADRVIFAGERTDVPALLKAADIFVLPSVSEGLPISLLEAMAARLPIVATRVGGIPELVRDGVTGALVAPGDSAGFAAAIAAYLDDPEAMRAAGKAGRARLIAQFSQAAMVERTEALYASLLSPRAAQELQHG